MPDPLSADLEGVKTESAFSAEGEEEEVISIHFSPTH
jgi:hypothetical protein